jgi:membrane protein
VAAGTERIGEAGSERGPVGFARVRSIGWTLTRETTAICFRYRVTGLAAEAGFFLLLSLPPLVLALVGGIGYLDEWLGADASRGARTGHRALRAGAHRRQREEVITPTLEDVLGGGRLRPDLDRLPDRAVVRLAGPERLHRHHLDHVRARRPARDHPQPDPVVQPLRASTLLGAIVIPLVLAGPDLLGRVLPEQVDSLDRLYWPVASLLSVVSLTSLYHVSVPVRTPWRRDLPGAC